MHSCLGAMIPILVFTYVNGLKELKIQVKFRKSARKQESMANKEILLIRYGSILSLARQQNSEAQTQYSDVADSYFPFKPELS